MSKKVVKLTDEIFREILKQFNLNFCAKNVLIFILGAKIQI